MIWVRCSITYNYNYSVQMFNFKVDTINIDYCYLNSRCACGICIVLCVGTNIDDIVRCAFYADVRALYFDKW